MFEAVLWFKAFYHVSFDTIHNNHVMKPAYVPTSGWKNKKSGKCIHQALFNLMKNRMVGKRKVDETEITLLRKLN